MPTASLAGLRGLATAMHPIVSHAGKFLIGLPVAYTIMCQIGGPCKVSGPSMLPTLSDPAWVLVYKLDPICRYKRGDVVLCKSVQDPLELVCKRITKMEGDQMGEVPPGHVWLEGDNPKESLDSRYYGPVPLALIQGRVTHQIQPRFRRLEKWTSTK